MIQTLGDGDRPRHSGEDDGSDQHDDENDPLKLLVDVSSFAHEAASYAGASKTIVNLPEGPVAGLAGILVLRQAGWDD